MGGREVSFGLLEQALNRYSSDPNRDHIPIVWSDAHLARLTQTAAGEGTIRSHIDQRMARAILMCAEGRFTEAEEDIVNCLRANYLDPRFYANSETSITLLNALFTVQHFDLLAAVLRDLYGFPAELKIGTYSAGFGRSCIRWTVSDANSHLFEFDLQSYSTDLTRETILGLQWSFPLYAKYAEGPECPPGSVIINQNDLGHVPGLAWCDSRPDYFLVPDCIFIPTKGYAYAREVFEKKAVSWADKASVGFWRGGTTGIPKSKGDWRSLERIKLCELANRPQNSAIMDCGLSSIVQFSDPQVIEEIQNSGFMRDRVPWEDWGNYKYHVDIDGNSSPWSNLFQRLLSGGVVMKVESSRGLRQWFYDELLPWDNYVPVAPDMSDLIDKVRWLQRNDGYASLIAERGRELALRLSYDHEIARGAATISSAFQYFQRLTN